MQKTNKVKIVKPELSIHKKLGNMRFEQAFDATKITRAEKVVLNSAPVFKENVLKDHQDLQELFKNLQTNLDRQDYKDISALAFSIKSRAATGGYPLASEVANSLFKFCDAASEDLPPNGYKAVKLHIDSLHEIFDNNFAAEDEAKGTKLVTGLAEVAQRFLSA